MGGARARGALSRSARPPRRRHPPPRRRTTLDLRQRRLLPDLRPSARRGARPDVPPAGRQAPSTRSRRPRGSTARRAARNGGSRIIELATEAGRAGLCGKISSSPRHRRPHDRDRRASATTSPSSARPSLPWPRPRSGDGREQGQVALPRLDEPRNQDADERHPRHDRSPARHRAFARAAHLCPRHLDLGQHIAVADRRGARLLQDRGRQDRASAGAVRHRRRGARRGRAVGAASPRQGPGNRLAGRAQTCRGR